MGLGVPTLGSSDPPPDPDLEPMAKTNELKIMDVNEIVFRKKFFLSIPFRILECFQFFSVFMSQKTGATEFI